MWQCCLKELFVFHELCLWFTQTVSWLLIIYRISHKRQLLLLISCIQFPWCILLTEKFSGKCPLVVECSKLILYFITDLVGCKFPSTRLSKPKCLVLVNLMFVRYIFLINKSQWSSQGFIFNGTRIACFNLKHHFKFLSFLMILIQIVWVQFSLPSLTFFKILALINWFYSWRAGHTMIFKTYISSHRDLSS